jgi:hypothetical protein
MNTVRAHFRTAWRFCRRGGTAFLVYFLAAILFAAFTPPAFALRATADTSAFAIRAKIASETPTIIPDLSAVVQPLFGGTKAETRVGVSEDPAPGRYLLVVAQRPDGTMVLAGYAYETASGRREWPNRDPIGEEAFYFGFTNNGELPFEESNLYAFLRNDPNERIDLLGLFSKFIDCNCCQIEALKKDEVIAQGHIASLKKSIQGVRGYPEFS